MAALKVLLYESQPGRGAMDKWLGRLDSTISQRVIKRLERIGLGNLGDHKFLAGAEGLLEFRERYGGGIRIYAGLLANTVVLLDAGNKDSQSRDIADAKTYWADFLREA